MSKFKVGDRVRFISAYNTQSNFGYLCDMLEIGEIGTIGKVIDGYRIRIKEGSYTYHPDDFELVDDWLTPGQALDAHLEGKDLIDEVGSVWGPKEDISTLVFKDNKFRVKPEIKWEDKCIQVTNQTYADIVNLKAKEEYLVFKEELITLTKEDALKIADFIIETYRGEE